MKKVRLRRWVKVVLVIFMLLGLIELGMLAKKSDDDFVKGCMEAGYSRQHCEKELG